MRKGLLFVAGSLLVLGACQSAPQTNRLKGVVTDATMNTIAVEAGDTLFFSTMDADRTGLDGLLVGDSVEVYYEGEYKPGMAALKVVSINGKI